MKILVLNCGSSSAKYQLFDMANEEVVLKGLVEKIGEARPVMIHEWGDKKETQEVDAKDHVDALNLIRDAVLDPARGGSADSAEIAAVGHRVVHGGEKFVASSLITKEIEEIIREYFSLAPLHNPPNMEGIRAAKKFFPMVPHVAVFDTSFHQTMPPKAFLYAMRYDMYEKYRIRRYGFHGTSHRYVAERAATLLGTGHDGFTGITCHLGNGCSLAAVQNGKSVDTTMGLTPLEGVPMGTRSGDIDPAIIFHFAETLGMELSAINKLLQKESGLKGVSGISNDLRDVEAAAAAGNERALLAAEVYGYRVRKYIGAYMAVLQGTNAIVFTGGVGQNGVLMRERIVGGLAHLGIKMDPARNQSPSKNSHGEFDIAAEDSPIRIFVIPTNEELMIAHDTAEIASKAKA
ncbi:MAG: acetate kinase [Candidatus Sumerlaeota bacterium]|nr:acetate kinase [Candidatus Sumerlaeota bacterium]